MYIIQTKTRLKINTIFHFLVVILLIGCTSENNHMTYVSWADYLNFAQKSAEKMADQPILMSVSAKPIHQPIGNNQHQDLKLSFLFSHPSGEQFDVSFNSANPEETMIIEERDQLDSPVLLGEQEALKSALSSVHIGPSEALSATLSIGSYFQNENGALGIPVIVLTLDPPEPGRFHLPALWRVTYFAPARRVTLHIWIHPETGEILAQDLLS